MGVRRIDVEEALSPSQLASSAAALSVFNGTDSAAYAIFDDAGKPLVFRAFDFMPHTHWIDRDGYSHLPFRRVHFAWCGQQSVLVPARLFDPSRPALYLQQITQLSADSEVLSEPVSGLDAYLVFSLPQSIASHWSQRYPHWRYWHILSVLLPPLHRHAQQLQEEVMHAFFQGSSLRVFVWRDGRLLLSNVFTCPTTKDFLYFCLLAIELSGCNLTQVKVFLLGELTQEGDIYTLLRRYIGRLAFMPAEEGTKPLGDLPAHGYLAHSWLSRQP